MLLTDDHVDLIQRIAKGRVYCPTLREDVVQESCRLFLERKGEMPTRWLIIEALRRVTGYSRRRREAPPPSFELNEDAHAGHVTTEAELRERWQTELEHEAVDEYLQLSRDERRRRAEEGLRMLGTSPGELTSLRTRLA